MDKGCKGEHGFLSEIHQGRIGEVSRQGGAQHENVNYAMAMSVGKVPRPGTPERGSIPSEHDPWDDASRPHNIPNMHVQRFNNLCHRHARLICTICIAIVVKAGINNIRGWHIDRQRVLSRLNSTVREILAIAFGLTTLRDFWDMIAATLQECSHGLCPARCSLTQPRIGICSQSYTRGLRS